MRNGVRISVFLPPSGGNYAGIERATTNLILGLAGQRALIELHLVLAEHYEQMPSQWSGVRLWVLGASRLRGCVLPLARYLREYRPDVFIVPQVATVAIVIAACRLARVKTRIISVVHGNVNFEESSSLSDRALFWLAKHFYRRSITRVIAVSEGVARGFKDIIGDQGAEVTTIYNPIITPAWTEDARATVRHARFTEGAAPLVLAVGRLSHQKGFDTLIRAFARVRKVIPVRLMIMGEGQERPRLEALVSALKLKNDVELPGYVAKPGPYMGQAAVFVFPSRWEGFGNVIVEAMSFGVPVIATACSYGPEEILNGGQYGRLVAVDDEQGLANAILTTLSLPPSDEMRKKLRARAHYFSQERAVSQYLDVIQEVMQFPP